MNVGLLRTLDAWIGLPLAWGLGLWPRSIRRRPKRPERMVIIKLFGLGSLFATAGVIADFRKRQPQCEVWLLTFAVHADIKRLIEVYDEILCVGAFAPWSLMRDIWKVWRRLRAWKPDLAVDVEYFSKLSTVFAALLGAGYRLGFLLPARWRRHLVDGGIAFREDIHFTECVARLLAPWGVDYHAPPAAAIRCTDDGAVSSRLAGVLFDMQAARWVTLNPNAHALCLERRWPVGHFAELIETLAASDSALQFALLGAGNERAHCSELLGRLKQDTRSRCLNLAGETDLSMVATLLERAVLFITNDSGLMHLGAGVGVPMVALFGPESALRYRPLMDASRLRLVQSDVPCGPCLTYMNHKRAPCRGQNLCMQSIAVETVTAACRDLLDS